MLSNEKIDAPASAGQVAGLVVGDLVMFALFVAIGRRSHSEQVSVAEIANVAAPFAIGWLATAPWLKLFRREVYASPREALARAALAWTLAAPIGLALRTFVWGREFKLPFAITTFLFNLAILLLWRGAAARKLRRG